MTEELGRAALREVALFFEPITKAAHSPYERQRIMDAIGWDLDAIAGFPATQYANALAALATAVDTLATRADAPAPTPADVKANLDAAGNAFDALFQLKNLVSTAGVPTPHVEEFAEDLLAYLIVQYLQKEHPLALALGEILGVVGTRVRPYLLDATGAQYRAGQKVLAIDLGEISKLLQDPEGTLRARYVPAFVTAADAKAVADRIFPPVAGALQALGVTAAAGVRSDALSDFGGAAAQIAPGMLTVISPPLGGAARIGATVGLSPRDLGDLGVVVVPFGIAQMETGLGGDWRAKLEVVGSAGAFSVGKDGFHLVSSAGSRLLLRLIVQKTKRTTSPALLIGSPQGPRLEIGTLRFTGTVDLQQGADDYGFLVEAEEGAIVVAPGEGDGFLRQILPAEGFRVLFALGLGWSKRRGLYFSGGAGLDVTLPVHLSLLGILDVDSVYLTLRADPQKASLVMAASPRVTLGPITAVVERVGFTTDLKFDQHPGNLGPVGIGFGFKFPSGVGLLIDAGPVTGGGFLSFDFDRQEYAGVVQLSFSGISLSAVGLLTTRMPGGSSGYSLLIIISGEFPPIQLGFGFTLLGVGGLLGIHRTINLDALQAGFRGGNINSIMFPQDPVRNAPQIISDLRAIFPPAQGRYVFGPMAKLGWGTPTILSVEIGLILEIPSPLRLVLLGKLKMDLPEEHVAIVHIECYVLGILDFDRQRASVDATLHDSRVAIFVLTGDMAMRASWGESSTFALSVGGLHPRFQPPPGFPSLRRVAIALATGNNPRLRLEAYLALTSNTAQVGAHLDAYAESSGFCVQGDLGFDALFEFSPFHFVVDMTAGVALKRVHGGTICSVRLDFTLEGPTPWHAHGKATVKLLFFSASVHFDTTFGEPDATLLPPGNAKQAILAALGDARNWSGTLPPEGQTLVTLRRLPPGPVLVHPLGTLTVRQRVVPLDVDISKFGSTTPGDDRRFHIQDAQIGTLPAAVSPVTEEFAPGQFVEMSHDAALSRPSFEPMNAGASMGTDAVTHGEGADADMEYETLLVDAKEETVKRLSRYKVSAAILDGVIAHSAAARSPMLTIGDRRFRGAPLRIEVLDPAFVVVSRDDLSVSPLVRQGGAGFTAAAQALEARVRAAPRDAGRYQIVALQETTSQ